MVIKYFNMPLCRVSFLLVAFPPSLPLCHPFCLLCGSVCISHFGFLVLVSAVRLCWDQTQLATEDSSTTEAPTTDADAVGGRNGGNSGCKLPSTSLWWLSFSPAFIASSTKLLSLCSSFPVKFVFSSLFSMHSKQFLYVLF